MVDKYKKESRNLSKNESAKIRERLPYIVSSAIALTNWECKWKCSDKTIKDEIVLEKFGLVLDTFDQIPKNLKTEEVVNILKNLYRMYTQYSISDQWRSAILEHLNRLLHAWKFDLDTFVKDCLKDGENG